MSAGPVNRTTPTVVSPGNSTTGSALAAAGVFLGTWERVTDYSEITYAINGAPSNAPGTLQFEFNFGLGTSLAQPNVGDSPDVTAGGLTIPGVGQVAPHTLLPVAKWFRVRYTNGATALTEFRLQTLYHYSTSQPLTRFAAQTMTDYDDLAFNKSILTGKYLATAPVAATDGTYPNVPVNLLGYLFTVNQPFLEDVALGRVPGHSVLHIQCRNPTVGTTYEDVWQNSGTHTYPAAAAVVSVVSTSTLDTNTAGTGIRQVVVNYLDASFNSQSETLNLNGIVAVTTTGTAIRVQSIQAVSVGTGGVAAGTITASVSATEQTRIAIGDNESQDSFFTVPNGKVVIMTSFLVGAGAADDVLLRFQSRATGANMPFINRRKAHVYQSAFLNSLPPATVYSAQTDLRWQAAAASGSIIADLVYNLLIINAALVA